MLDSVSHPGTSSSLQDYFEKCNPDDEDKVIAKGEMDEEDKKRSQSVEEDIYFIRNAIGSKFMRSSTQGYQLLMARARQSRNKIMTTRNSYTENLFDDAVDTADNKSEDQTIKS